MRAATVVLAGLATAMATWAAPSARAQGAAPLPLTLHSARVTLEGTSNVHAFTASTHTIVIRSMEVAGTPGEDILDTVLQPGHLKSVEVTIPARSLTSPRDGIDRNMHKALKVDEHPNIRFRLAALEPADGGYRASGLLTIAGVEKPIVLGVEMQRTGATLALTGTTDLLMTDFGIAPPRAMLGMLKTNPLVTIRLELQLGGR